MGRTPFLPFSLQSIQKRSATGGWPCKINEASLMRFHANFAVVLSLLGEEPKLFDVAYAMTQNGAAGAGQAGGVGGMFLPLIMVVMIFYFLVFRPNSQRQKEHKKMLEGLKKGNKVITSGGIMGKIVKIDESVVTLEISDKVDIKVLKGNVSLLNPPQAEVKKEN